MKFTKEIKEKWLNALKSGKYKQGFYSLVIMPKSNGNKSGTIEHCCIGVLGEITKGLNNDSESQNTSQCPYKFLEDNLNRTIINNLVNVNDNGVDKNNQDYRNVIPLIEQLKTS